MGRARDGLVVGASRVVAIGGVVALVGALPWLSGRSPEYTILRARYADLEATPEALAAVARSSASTAGRSPSRSTGSRASSAATSARRGSPAARSFPAPSTRSASPSR